MNIRQRIIAAIGAVVLALSVLLGAGAAQAAPVVTATPVVTAVLIPIASTSRYVWVQVDTRFGSCRNLRGYTGSYYTDPGHWPRVFCKVRR